MKIREALAAIDEARPNKFTEQEKVAWLSQLDGRVKLEIIDTHEDDEKVIFDGYDESTDIETELLIPEPFSDIYLRHMEAQMDYLNGEIARYNNSVGMFNAQWKAYRNWYNRMHAPKGHKFKFF